MLNDIITTKSKLRYRIHVNGYVQGVGFRPYVAKLAQQYQLNGWVRNTANGIEIEIQGVNSDVFIKQLPKRLPDLARIDELKFEKIAWQDNDDFTILESQRGEVTTKVGADTVLCNQCLQELFDPQSRFYQYPFISCMHCGPRYSITQALPYDRSNTSMQSFKLCQTCHKAYHNLQSRRYHTQTIACANCGPQLSHHMNHIVNVINAGKIVALKGLGGFQLICDARNNNAVERLRSKKQRGNKPFAVMILNSNSAHTFAKMSKLEQKYLNSSSRPIVLLTKNKIKLAKDIAPGLTTLGIMLPTTPIHYLIFHALLNSPQNNQWLDKACQIALVVTSANIKSEPLLIDNAIAEKKLENIADLIVDYDRDIVTRLDDSVMRVIADGPVFIRRARGFTPIAIELPHDIPPTLALGAYLKNTVCVTRGKEAFISQHIGDLGNLPSQQFFHETIEHLLKILDVKPQCVAHDRHPDFYSTQFAAELAICSHAIQHHHAHLNAVIAEHKITQPVLGLALDGFGLGDDGGMWGGELMHLQGVHYKRLSHLNPVRMPGGEKAAYECWRMAVSVLHQLKLASKIPPTIQQNPKFKDLIKIIEHDKFSPLSSSMGRLFDAASAILGLCEQQDYEAQAAMLLESQVTKLEIIADAWQLGQGHLDLLPCFNYLLNVDMITGANRFHGIIVQGLTEWIKYWSEQTQIKSIVLSGGCFINKILTENLIKNLQAEKITSYLPRQSAINDAGISLGQAWIAGNYYYQSTMGLER